MNYFTESTTTKHTENELTSEIIKVEEPLLHFSLSTEDLNLYNFDQNLNIMKILNKTLDDDIFYDRKSYLYKRKSLSFFSDLHSIRSSSLEDDFDTCEI